jgi:Fe-S-cluster-containing hydrogenase component 2/CRP-like cAMP-binding protein/thioredoxin reductase
MTDEVADMSEPFKIAIVGSGPSGLSAAGRAAQLGISHVLLEAAPHAADTIYKYQKGKHVMAEPAVLPLRSAMSFEAGKREKILGTWDQELASRGVNIRFGAEVTGITGTKSDFHVRLAGGAVIDAEFVVLAIGLQGNLRKVGVAGEDLPQVQYQLDDPEEYEDETIVVIGAGDAAIENALALAKQNRVILINRNEEFARCKEGNLGLVLAAIEDERIECRYGTRAERIDAVADANSPPISVAAQTPQGSEVIACHRVIARLGATPPRKLVESFGVVFPSTDPSAVPQLSATYESNVPGLYIIGALGGYPLIKQAMNQGYEVVESILGRSVEPADEPLLRAKFASYHRAHDVNEGLELIRANVPVFAELTTLQLREFLLDSEILTPPAGTLIFKRNDYTNSFFSVLEGEALVIAEGENGKASQYSRTAGAFFGEMGLISGRRRSATVQAGAGCVLLETPRRSMLKLLASVESAQRKVDEVSLKRVVQSYLAADIPEHELDYLVHGALLKRYPAGAVLFNEGDEADGLYLIRRGSVTVSRNFGGRDTVLSYVAAGNFVGEMALVSESRRTATIRAAVYTEAIMLQTTRVTDVAARNTSMRGTIAAQARGRMRSNEALSDQSDSGNLISFLVKQGIGEATDVLLIDESLCIRCNNCEKACTDTHGGTSRLNREAGPTYAQIHVPTSCRHCEHPHCMKDCPPDAIRRNPSGEVFISDACIGCGNCERNCPYGVIQMASVNPQRKRPSLLRWLMFGMGSEPGLEQEAEDKSQPKKAVKCDMCATLANGPACVNACPTGAALRVSPEKFLSYAGADGDD